jgi:hypothetical protein
MKQFQITVVSEKETPDGSSSLRYSVVETVRGSSFKLSEGGHLLISSEGTVVATYAPGYWCSISEPAS